MWPPTFLPCALLLLFLTTFSRGDESDLQIETTRAVTCSRPTKSGDRISVHYRGTLLSTGEVFDQSFPLGPPITFRLGSSQVIEGWDRGLLDMCPGEERKLTIPPELAYGDRGAPPVIPGGATLVFETILITIEGVEEEWVSTLLSQTATKTEESFSIATSPSEPPPPPPSSGDDSKVDMDDTVPDLGATPLTTQQDEEPGQCHLLGPFALMVQGALGAVALLALVYKRWRETPKRPWKIFFFDVSKQVVGSGLTHVLNLAMSMLASIDMVHATQNAVANTPDKDMADAGPAGRQTPNPCSFYILNLGIDTTLGIPVLYLLLKILHAAFLFTPLARPSESIKSGHYIPTNPADGTSPRATWWLKQCLIYFIGLTGMKLFVLSLFALLPWLPWIGDWALRWTEGNEVLQIAFAMFIFPLLMNAVQYWIIDSFIMEKQQKKSSSGNYERVRGEGDDSDDEDGGGHGVVERVDEVHGKSSEDGVTNPPLTEVNPTPVPNYDERAEGSGSSLGGSPKAAAKVANDVDVDADHDRDEVRERR